MNISRLKTAILYRLPVSIRFFIETIIYWHRLCRFNASVKTEHDKVKMQYTILRENHIIEKGMSMRNTRQGFGQVKVSSLIRKLLRYIDLYGANGNTFLEYPVSTINEYIKYQKQEGVEISEIECLFRELCEKMQVSPGSISLPAGIEYVTRESLQTAARGDFSMLLHSRHSIRYFSDKLPSIDIINQALELASRTPSACNRQAWHTHVYFNEDSHRLLKMQDGCRGFHDDIHCSIVVTADMKGFLDHEPFQCYIDGGLYAQNLINSLHYVGLGTIPLSCGFLSHKLDDIKKVFNIPQNEVLIVIIGTGVMTDKMKIAKSTRRPISCTNTYHCH